MIILNAKITLKENPSDTFNNNVAYLENQKEIDLLLNEKYDELFKNYNDFNDNDIYYYIHFDDLSEDERELITRLTDDETFSHETDEEYIVLTA